METSYLSNLAICVEKEGPSQIVKASFPLRYGTYSEIRTSEYEFRFNLNGEIKFIRGLHTGWPHPAEQLKRTDGNDWVYYSVGDKSSEQGIVSWLGEYYLPCLPYPSNSIWEINYYANPAIMNAFAAWPQLFGSLYEAKKDRLHTKVQEMISSVLANHDGVLYQRAHMLNEIIGGRVSVLPPDTRHVDYEVIPLIIADGCRYHCNFCCVQSDRKFKARPRFEIQKQIKNLKDFYGRNIKNYNGLFLGNHDALGAGEDVLLESAADAYTAFGFAGKNTVKPKLFLFGSAYSLLNSSPGVFERINQLPFYTYINIGLESCDRQTLKEIGKPLDTSDVHDAFEKILSLNAAYENIEVTANFVMGEGLSPEHYESLNELLNTTPVTSKSKGAIYLSPLQNSPKKRELLPLVHEVQEQSKLPVYVYLIQRL